MTTTGEADADAGGKIRLWGAGTSRTIRPLWTLLELGLEFEHEPILTRTPMMETPTFKAVSPRGKIPILDDGPVRIGESAAISLYLADRYRDRCVLAPPPGTVERALHDELCFFTTAEMDAILYTIRRHEGLPEIYGASEVAVEGARAYFERSATEVVRRLEDGRPFVTGEAFTIADLMLSTCLEWAKLIDGITLAPELLRYAARLAERPAFAEAMKRNFTPEAMAALRRRPESD